MRYFFIIIIFLIIGCTRHKHIESGTTILAALTPNSIILFADSRAELVAADFSEKHYVDTINKIHKMGKYFYEVAGTTHFRDIDIYNVISHTFSRDLSLKANSEKINIAILEVLNSYYGQLTKNELEYYKKLIPEWGMLQIFIAGYESPLDECPSFSHLEFKIENKESHYEVSISNNYYIKFNKTSTGLIEGGFHAQIQKILSKGYNTKNLGINDLKYLISLEADSSKNIGYDYNYVIIKKNSYTLGKSY